MFITTFGFFFLFFSFLFFSFLFFFFLFCFFIIILMRFITGLTFSFAIIRILFPGLPRNQIC
ncbi:MAG: hypothetical protein DSY43_06775 [Gammaproteobacteria bacterium]|nr:MAG: hypothetical protein DSY43_06775 [Gammaproteobacteria bacterium]